MATRRKSGRKSSGSTGAALEDLSLLTRMQLARVFAKDPRTIAKWLEEGMPVAVKGRGGRPSRYSLPHCVQWVIDREMQTRGTPGAENLSPQKERALLDRMRREDIELRMQVRRGELVAVEDVTREYADLAVGVKSKLRGIPDAVADLLVAVSRKGPAAVRNFLLAKIDDALRDLARGAEIPLTLVVEEEAEPHAEDQPVLEVAPS